jgi:hypothetical protein
VEDPILTQCPAVKGLVEARHCEACAFRTLLIPCSRLNRMVPSSTCDQCLAEAGTPGCTLAYLHKQGHDAGAEYAHVGAVPACAYPRLLQQAPLRRLERAPSAYMGRGEA